MAHHHHHALLPLLCVRVCVCFFFFFLSSPFLCFPPPRLLGAGRQHPAWVPHSADAVAVCTMISSKSRRGQRLVRRGYKRPGAFTALFGNLDFCGTTRRARGGFAFLRARALRGGGRRRRRRRKRRRRDSRLTSTLFVLGWVIRQSAPRK